MIPATMSPIRVHATMRPAVFSASLVSVPSVPLAVAASVFSARATVRIRTYPSTRRRAVR
jgi:hypothetical protein